MSSGLNNVKELMKKNHLNLLYIMEAHKKGVLINGTRIIALTDRTFNIFDHKGKKTKGGFSWRSLIGISINSPQITLIFSQKTIVFDQIECNLLFDEISYILQQILLPTEIEELQLYELGASKIVPTDIGVLSRLRETAKMMDINISASTFHKIENYLIYNDPLISLDESTQPALLPLFLDVLPLFTRLIGFEIPNFSQINFNSFQPINENKNNSSISNNDINGIIDNNNDNDSLNGNNDNDSHDGNNGNDNNINKMSENNINVNDMNNINNNTSINDKNKINSNYNVNDNHPEGINNDNPILSKDIDPKQRLQLYLTLHDTYSLLLNWAKQKSNLKYISIDSPCTPLFFQFIHNLEQNEGLSLKCLSFKSSQFEITHLNEIHHYIISKNLQSIEFHHAFSQSSFSYFYNIFLTNQLCSTIKILNLDGTYGLDAQAIFAKVRFLTAISLSGCQLDIPKVLEIISNSDLPGLRMLNLSENNYTRSIAPGTHLPDSLFSLALNDVTFSDKAFPSLITFLRSEFPNNFQLSLARVSTSESSWIQFFSILTEEPGLNFSENFCPSLLVWDENPVTPEFWNYLTNNPNLTSISLSGCVNFQEDIFNLEYCVHFIKNNLSLQELIMYGNEEKHIGEWIIPLLKASIGNPNLVSIDFSNSYCGDNGIIQLTSILGSLTVKELFLDGTHPASSAPFMLLLHKIVYLMGNIFIGYLKNDAEHLIQTNACTEELLKNIKARFALDNSEVASFEFQSGNDWSSPRAFFQRNIALQTNQRFDINFPSIPHFFTDEMLNVIQKTPFLFRAKPLPVPLTKSIKTLKKGKSPQTMAKSLIRKKDFNTPRGKMVKSQSNTPNPSSAKMKTPNSSNASSARSRARTQKPIFASKINNPEKPSWQFKLKVDTRIQNQRFEDFNNLFSIEKLAKINSQKEGI